MQEIPFEVGGHRWTDYRPAGETRHAIPADICVTCSDEEVGRLVPISFCPVFAPLVEAEYRAQFGPAAP